MWSPSRFSFRAYSVSVTHNKIVLNRFKNIFLNAIYNSSTHITLVFISSYCYFQSSLYNPVITL